jgi:hypothetical protein
MLIVFNIVVIIENVIKDLKIYSLHLQVTVFATAEEGLIG